MKRPLATRSTAPFVAAMAAIVLAATTLTACDTGDGKTLHPYDPADYPSQAVATTVPESDGFGAGGFDGDGVEPTSPPVSADADWAVEPFALFAPWEQGGTIDRRNTCDGEDISPALSWGGAPAGTVEIALSLVDDSVVENGEPFVHWVIAGLDPHEIALVEGDVPAGAIHAINFFGFVGYNGPCPPVGDDPHLYRLTAYALNQSPGVADETPAIEFLDAIERVTLDSADLSASYSR